MFSTKQGHEGNLTHIAYHNITTTPNKIIDSLASMKNRGVWSNPMTEIAGEFSKQEARSITGFLSKHASWMQKISGALVDQAVFAGGNFIINIILARHMSVDEYGTFVVVYTWFLLCQNVYDAFLTEPMAILGSGKYFKQFKTYLGYTFIGHLVVASVLALSLGIAAYITNANDSSLVAVTMLTAALVAPLLLLRWLTRQPFYILAKPHWSAVGSSVYFVLSLTGVILLDHFGELTPSSVLIVMGASSLVSSTVLTLVFLKPKFKSTEALSGRAVLRDHWNYGKWSSGSKMLTWIPINLYYVILPVLVSLGASAALRAMNNVLMPLNMGITAALGILLPMFSRTFIESGSGGLHHRVKLVLIWFVVISGVYCLVFSLFGQRIISIIYNGQFDDFVTFPILLTMGLAPMIVSINTVLDASLRVMNKMKQSFLSTLVPAILIITVGVWLLSQYGLLGANLGSLVIGLAETVVLVKFYRDARHSHAGGEKTESDIPLADSAVPEA